MSIKPTNDGGLLASQSSGHSQHQLSPSQSNNRATQTIIPGNNQLGNGTPAITTNNDQPSTPNNDANSPVVDSRKQLTETIDKLSKKAIDTLWKLNVSNAAWYAKPIGLIQYMWHRSEAIAKDKEDGSGATIDKFNKAAAELVKAIANRTLNPKEVQALGHPPLPFENADEQQNTINLDLDAQNKLRAFYKVFKERITQLNGNAKVTDDQFISYGIAAKEIIKDLSLSEKLTQGSLYSATLATKIKTTLRCFDEKTLKDVVDTYAAQPLADITIESFQKEAKKIRNFFKLDSIEPESELRKAIINKHQKADFESICGELANPSPTALKDAEGKIKTELKAEKSKLEAELDVICGSDRQDGTFVLAKRAKKAAKEAWKKNENIYRTQLSAFYSLEDISSFDSRQLIESRHLIEDASTSDASTSAAYKQNLECLRQKLGRLNKEFEEKSKSFESVRKRYNELVRREDNQLVGGQIFAVDEKLDSEAIKKAAKDEMTRQARFYEELGKEITKENGADRSKALNAIFNGNDDSQSINSDATTSSSQGATSVFQGIEEFLGAPDVKQVISNIIQFFSQPNLSSKLSDKGDDKEERSTPTTKKGRAFSQDWGNGIAGEAFTGIFDDANRGVQS